MYISSEAPLVEDDRCLSTGIWFVNYLIVYYVRVSSTSVSYAYHMMMSYFKGTADAVADYCSAVNCPNAPNTF